MGQHQRHIHPETRRTVSVAHLHFRASPLYHCPTAAQLDLSTTAPVTASWTSLDPLMQIDDAIYCRDLATAGDDQMPELRPSIHVLSRPQGLALRRELRSWPEV